MSSLVCLLSVFVAVTVAYPSGSDADVHMKSLYYNRAEGIPDRQYDSVASLNLMRDLDALRNRAEYFERQDRQINALSGDGFGISKKFEPLDPLKGGTFGTSKRNGMDEIDRSSFSGFFKKKNFDEIDRSGFDSFVKRNFDEIDRSSFNSFVKRNVGSNLPPRIE
uniref:Neuropeptide PDF n=2 Tax=Diaphorina citri TaxID=121845 RepID=A0A2U9PFS5_DIACI|nr:neuropeptide PDF [Diaphorina citri]